MKISEEHRKLLKLAQDRFSDAVDGDRENREHAYNDLEFLTNTGDGHWPEDVRKWRKGQGKPCITVNRLPQLLRQVTGDIRRVNPAIKIIPGDAVASEDMAELRGGMVRHIEAASSATSIYEGATEAAAACGIGHWRLLTEYCDDDSFDQEIKIDSIPNPFSVYWDPAAKDPTRKDARFCFIVEDMPEDDFKAEYPNAAIDEWPSDDTVINWNVGGERVRVAEYFWVETKDERIALLGDGTVIRNPPAGAKFPRERTVAKRVVKWAKISGCEVLEGPTEWPGRWIPVVSVVGEEMHVGERVVRSSVIRYAKEPQTLYNYARSAQAEVIAMQPRAPFMVTPKQVKQHEKMWGALNSSASPFLLYNPDPDAPAPQRQNPPVPSSAFMQEIALAAEDLKATTGIFDASMGAQGNETSGVAIQQRQIQGDTANSIYVDNLARSIEHTGRIILDLMPKIYDSERYVRVLGEDGAETLERINGMMLSQDGVVPVNPMDRGKYDVRVSTGPAYQTLRQEAADGMLQFVQAYPAAAPAVGDLIAESMDWPRATEFAERLKKMAPPGLIEKSPDEMSPEEQQAMQQQQAMMQQMQQLQEVMQQMQMRLMAAEVSEKEANAQLRQANAARAVAQVQEMEVNTGLKVDAQRFDQAAKVAEIGARQVAAFTQQGQ